jgi:hypothetical protein
VIGGVLRGSEAPGARVSGLVRVCGGTVRLFRCKLEGTASCRALVRVDGSGEMEPDRNTHACAINESVLVSRQGGVRVQGAGARLLVRQSLLVAGTEALQLFPADPGQGHALLGGFGAPRAGRAAARKDRGRTNQSCFLENVTFAARQAVVRLGDDPEAGVPAGPVFVQARDCAYLNPFPGKAGMLLYEGQALPRGLLLWQSERDAFDRRLHFGAAAVGKVPDKPEGLRLWKESLWGAQGVRETPAKDLVLRGFPPRAWPLERLVLPPGRGADLKALGIGARKPTR